MLDFLTVLVFALTSTAILYTYIARSQIHEEAEQARLTRSARKWLKEADSQNRKRDLALFLERDIDIMDVTQLAEGQNGKSDLREVFVFAPDFLELHSEDVFQSTVETLSDPTRNVIFWFFLSNENGDERFKLLIKRLEQHVPDGVDVGSRVKRIELPNRIFFGDYTIWNPHGPNPTGFQNLKGGGKTTFCVRMPYEQVTDVTAKLDSFISEANRKGGHQLASVTTITPQRNA